MQAQTRRIVDRRSCSNSLRGFVGNIGQLFVKRKKGRKEEREKRDIHLESNDITKKISFVRTHRINETP